MGVVTSQAGDASPCIQRQVIGHAEIGPMPYHVLDCRRFVADHTCLYAIPYQAWILLQLRLRSLLHARGMAAIALPPMINNRNIPIKLCFMIYTSYCVQAELETHNDLQYAQILLEVRFLGVVTQGVVVLQLELKVIRETIIQP